MPFGDRTGPRGRGSRTGRGAGFCARYDMPGYMNRGLGFNRGRGRGFGRGRSGGFGRGRGFFSGFRGTPLRYNYSNRGWW